MPRLEPCAELANCTYWRCRIYVLARLLAGRLERCAAAQKPQVSSQSTRLARHHEPPEFGPGRPPFTGTASAGFANRAAQSETLSLQRVPVDLPSRTEAGDAVPFIPVPRWYQWVTERPFGHVRPWRRNGSYRLGRSRHRPHATPGCPFFPCRECHGVLEGVREPLGLDVEAKAIDARSLRMPATLSNHVL